VPIDAGGGGLFVRGAGAGRRPRRCRARAAAPRRRRRRRPRAVARPQHGHPCRPPAGGGHAVLATVGAALRSRRSRVRGRAVGVKGAVGAKGPVEPPPNRPRAPRRQVTVEPLGGSHEGVSLLTLDRPDARNALGRRLVRELLEALGTLRQERTTRAVLLRSRVPGCFSAGADLKERAAMTQREAAEAVGALRRLMDAVAGLPMPTVAVLEGYALGGGAELALACDLRVASRGAALAFPEARLGIMPGAGGTQRLPRLVGLAAAKELVFTARRVGGEEAAGMGLVDHCVEDGRALDRALEIAADIAKARGPRRGRARVCVRARPRRGRGAPGLARPGTPGWGRARGAPGARALRAAAWEAGGPGPGGCGRGGGRAGPAALDAPLGADAPTLALALPPPAPPRRARRWRCGWPRRPWTAASRPTSPRAWP
jgi:methylglutaconyl-CoA hydratase